MNASWCIIEIFHGIVSYGIVWYHVVLNDSIWYCMVSSSMVWYHVVLYNIVSYWHYIRMCPAGCSVITCHLTIIYCTNFSTVATLCLSCLRHIFHLGQILCIFEGESWECIRLYFISRHKHFMLNPGLLSEKFTLSEIQLWPVTGAGGFLKHGVTLSLIKSSLG